MIAVYQIRADETAPELYWKSPEVGSFAGTPKVGLSPKAAFRGEVAAPPASARQFYRSEPGVLLLPEEAWTLSEEMYYCCSMGSELLAVDTAYGTFRAINPLDFLPEPAGGGAPCLVDRFYAPVVRISGQDPTHLFCVAGVGVRGDEFKYVYDTFGFSGLRFEEVWRDGTVNAFA